MTTSINDEEKHFNEWMNRKEHIHNVGKIRSIREGENLVVRHWRKRRSGN